MAITKGLAFIGYRVLVDSAFFDKVINTYSTIDIVPL